MSNKTIGGANMNTYFKSFVTIEHQPVNTTYDPVNNSRTTCQTLSNILETAMIRPNTVHSQLEKRLCASLVNPGYPGTYRSEGLVFGTEAKPDFAAPFDLMTLTSGKTFTSLDYYNAFLDGHESFLYSSIEDMLNAYPDSGKAIVALNDFRKKHGLDMIDAATMNYNECCFEQDTAIRPIALIGQTREYKALSEEFGVPLYRTFEDYSSKQRSSTLYDFIRKSVVGAIFRVGSSFAIDAATYLAVTGGNLGDFAERFQLDKFLTVTAAVVAVNFVDYKFNITNRLDRLAKKGIDKMKS